MVKVLIFAGGTGRRMNARTKPKQFLMMHGRPIILYTLEKFERHPDIGEIVIVCLEGWIDRLWDYIHQYMLKKVTIIVPGGPTGHDSIYNGLVAMEQTTDPRDIVLIHDGVRPLITPELITTNIQAVKNYGNAITAEAVRESVVRSHDGVTIDSVPPYLHDEIRGILAAHGYHHATGLDPVMEYREMAAYLRGKGFPSLDLPADGGTGGSRETEARDAAANSAAPRADAAAQALAAAGIAIYVACSAADPPLAHARPESPMYHTVQAGAALSPAIGAELRDDTGGNISRENPHCDELTVTYWAWKNRRDPVKGIAHYRRYLAARPAEYAALLDGTADALLPLPFVCWPDTATQYSRYNAPEAVAAMHAAIAAVHPGEAETARAILAGPYLYNYNMLIARAAVFDDYCAWLFPILAHVRAHAPALFPPDTHTRVCGHLGELLYSIYMISRRDRLRLLHVPKVWLT